ncbi:hypothetical protein N780_13260 [Pontibacillus chungwhensis BH030062]|uniref:Uncharacterized protein n=1 Tax=Pontibacillus chungwhensis BH030062 TaxID=1385513 RepID=A0A0A2V2P3_9BACI|nr:hypothetical protein [Pontibacillus chungwhensis]KGP93313.1 hypothetical protein N780_13260 [Pontibacillus chungwhensis BH030062]
MLELFLWTLASFIVVMVSSAFGIRELFVNERWWWPTSTLLCLTVLCGAIAALTSLFASQIIELDKPAAGLYYTVRIAFALSITSFTAYLILMLKVDREHSTLTKGLRLVENRRQKKEGASQ